MAGREDLEVQLRRLSLNDESLIEEVLGTSVGTSATALDTRTAALVRLAALVAMDAETPTYQWAVTEAFGCGATPDELLAVLITIAPAIGQARVVTAAPKLALAMGHDVQHAIEGVGDLEPPPTEGF